MKDKLLGVFGGFGWFIYLLLGFLLVFAPLYIVGIPIWAKGLFIAAYYFAPTIMSFVLAPLYVWAIVVAVRQPIDTVSIIFFVCAAVYFFVILFPTIVALLGSKK